VPDGVMILRLPFSTATEISTSCHGLTDNLDIGQMRIKRDRADGRKKLQHDLRSLSEPGPAGLPVRGKVRLLGFHNHSFTDKRLLLTGFFDGMPFIDEMVGRRHCTGDQQPGEFGNGSAVFRNIVQLVRECLVTPAN
jgi:hypothetical protein